MTTLLIGVRHPGVAGGRRDARLPDHHFLSAPAVGCDLDAIPQTAREACDAYGCTPTSGPGAVRGERRWPMAPTLLAAVAPPGGNPASRPRPGLVGLPDHGSPCFSCSWWWWTPGEIDSRARFTRRLTIGLIAVMSAATLGVIVVPIYDILGGLPGINATDLLGRGARPVGDERGRLQPLVLGAGPRRCGRARRGVARSRRASASPRTRCPSWWPRGGCRATPTTSTSPSRTPRCVQPDGHAARSGRGRR